MEDKRILKREGPYFLPQTEEGKKRVSQCLKEHLSEWKKHHEQNGRLVESSAIEMKPGSEHIPERE